MDLVLFGIPHFFHVMFRAGNYVNNLRILILGNIGRVVIIIIMLVSTRFQMAGMIEIIEMIKMI